MQKRTLALKNIPKIQNAYALPIIQDKISFRLGIFVNCFYKCDITELTVFYYQNHIFSQKHFPDSKFWEF